MVRTVVLIPLDRVPLDRGAAVRAEGLDLAVFRQGEQVFAIDDSCPHHGASLSAGRLEGQVVTCPAHGLKFNVRSGQALASPALCNKTYPVCVQDGHVVLQMDEK